MRAIRFLLFIVVALGASMNLCVAATVYIATPDSSGSTSGESAALNAAIGSAIQVANSYGFAGVRLVQPFDPMDPTSLCTNDRPSRRQAVSEAVKNLIDRNQKATPPPAPSPDAAALLQPGDLLLVLGLTRADQTFNKFTGAFTNDVLLNVTQIVCPNSATRADSGKGAADMQAASSAAAAQKLLSERAKKAAEEADTAAEASANAEKAASAKGATADQQAAAKKAAAAAQEAASKAAAAADAARGGVISSGWGPATRGALIHSYNQNPIAGLGAVAAMLTSPWVNKYRLWLGVPTTFLDSFKHEQRSLEGTIYCATTEAMLDMMFQNDLIKIATTGYPRAYHRVGDRWRRVPGVNYCKQRQPVRPNLNDAVYEVNPT